MTGVLFRNDKRETVKHPEFTGNIVIDGEEIRLAAWVNESKAGKKYFRLKASRSEPKKAKESEPEFDDDIPFAWAFAAVGVAALVGVLYGAQDVLQMLA